VLTLHPARSREATNFDSGASDVIG